MPELGKDNDKIPKLSYTSLKSISDKNIFKLRELWVVTDVDGKRKTVLGFDDGYWYTATGLDVGNSKRALALLYTLQLWYPELYPSKDLADADIPQEVEKNWHWTPDLGFKEFWRKE